MSVEPTLVVHPLPDKLEWWLRSECVLFGHVQIIHINDHFLSVWHHLGFCSLYELTLDRLLCFERTGLAAEDNVHGFPDRLVQLRQNLIDQHCLTCSCNTNAQSVNFVLHTVHQDKSISGRIDRRYQHLMEWTVWWWFPDSGVDLLFPASPLILLIINVVVIDCKVAWEHALNLSNH